MPVESHKATIRVTPDGDGAGSVVTWAYEVAPDSMADMMAQVYQVSLAALKTHLETH